MINHIDNNCLIGYSLTTNIHQEIKFLLKQIMDNQEEKYAHLKERFLKIYSNLPVNLREEIIYVIEGKGPITWNVAYLEVQANTDLARTILYNLDELGVI